MKSFVGVFMSAVIVVLSVGQSLAQAPVFATKVLAEISASTEKIVKGTPFSADAVSESTQILADGNRIVRSSTSKLFRNSEGGFRRETRNGSDGLFGSVYSSGPWISILDPIVGHRYQLDPTAKTMVKGTLRMTETDPTKSNDMIRTEANAMAIEGPLAAERLRSQLRIVAASDNKVNFAQSVPGATNYGTRTEQLGVRNIEGIQAEGTRTTTTIQAGTVDNQRQIEMVYECWFSNEFQLVVLSRHIDPRFGEENYRLTNIVYGEPDRSLFSLPTDYKVIEGGRAGVVNLAGATKVEAERAARGEGKVKATRPPN